MERETSSERIDTVVTLEISSKIDSTKVVRKGKPRVSPGIEKIKRVFEIEKETEKREVEIISKVEKIKNSFELLMGREKRERESIEERHRERQKRERKEKR